MAWSLLRRQATIRGLTRPWLKALAGHAFRDRVRAGFLPPDKHSVQIDRHPGPLHIFPDGHEAVVVALEELRPIGAVEADLDFACVLAWKQSPRLSAEGYAKVAPGSSGLPEAAHHLGTTHACPVAVKDIALSRLVGEPVSELS